MARSKELHALVVTGIFGCALWAVVMFAFWQARYPATNKEGAQGMFVVWEFLPVALAALFLCILLCLLIWGLWCLLIWVFSENSKKKG